MIKKESKRILLSSPHLGGKETLFIQEALDSNWVGPVGNQITQFEIELANYLGHDKHITATNTGTAAIHLALILAGVQKGDMVLCQSLTFSATVNPVLYQGATPVFIDSETDTWNLSPEILEKAIKDQLSKDKRPKAIIVVHLYGMPAMMDEIRNIAKKYQIVLIEDAAEALGATYKSQKCGTMGDYGILSFNGNKIITTSAGGALITNTIDLKDKAVYLATQARDTAPHYQHSEIGYNYRMSNICAGIGRGQLEVLDRHIQHRKDMHKFYQAMFEAHSEVTMMKAPLDYFYSNHWLSAILLESYEQRESLRLHLEKANIESRPLWKPMHLQPVFEKYDFYGEGVSENLFNRGLCLPSGSNLSKMDRTRIKEQISTFFK